MKELIKLAKKNLYYIAWSVSLAATLGSLFFSEVLKFPPCILCWYQRIFMYPLVFLIPVGIMKKDKNLPYFILPLASIGATIAVFHNLLYYGLIPESTAPCILGISCTTKFIEYFGFITIPFLSLSAFLTIIICMYLAKKYNK